MQLKDDDAEPTMATVTTTKAATSQQINLWDLSIPHKTIPPADEFPQQHFTTSRASSMTSVQNTAALVFDLTPMIQEAVQGSTTPSPVSTQTSKYTLTSFEIQGSLSYGDVQGTLGVNQQVPIRAYLVYTDSPTSLFVDDSVAYGAAVSRDGTRRPQEYLMYKELSTLHEGVSFVIPKCTLRLTVNSTPLLQLRFHVGTGGFTGDTIDSQITITGTSHLGWPKTNRFVVSEKQPGQITRKVHKNQAEENWTDGYYWPYAAGQRFASLIQSRRLGITGSFPSNVRDITKVTGRSAMTNKKMRKVTKAEMKRKSKRKLRCKRGSKSARCIKKRMLTNLKKARAAKALKAVIGKSCKKGKSGTKKNCAGGISMAKLLSALKK